MSELSTLLAAIGHTAALPFERAVTLPSGAYTDPAFTALEIEKLFGAEWICVGRADEIPSPGDYVTHRLADTPVIVMRQGDGSIKALVNICRHRSAQLLSGSGHVAKIVCPYHAWSFELSGELAMAPFMGKQFDKAGTCLPELRTDQWEGWLYVTLNADAAPVSGRLQGLSRRVAAYRMADQVNLYRYSEVWACNWKSLAENFTESYHLFSSHKETLQPFTPTQGVWCEPGEAAWNIHWMDTSRLQDQVWEEADEETRKRFPLMHVYPCHVLSVSMTRGFWMSLQPDGPDRVRVLWGVTIHKALLPEAPEALAALKAETAETFNAINLEDRTIVESIARSLKSPHAAEGRLGEKERTLWEFWRYLARAVDAPAPASSIAAA
jgi:choline monooxygenase